MRTTLRITKKNFQDEGLRHELILTKRQNIKIRNVFVFLLGKFAAWLMKVAVPLVIKFLAALATMASASAIDGASQREMYSAGVVKARNGIALAISNEDMNDIIRILKPLENSGVLIDGVNEALKHKIKNKVDFLVCF